MYVVNKPLVKVTVSYTVGSSAYGREAGGYGGFVCVQTVLLIICTCTLSVNQTQQDVKDWVTLVQHVRV